MTKKKQEVAISISAEQEHFIELIAQGYTEAAACNDMKIEKEQSKKWLLIPTIKRAILKRSQELMAEMGGQGKEAVLEIAKTIMFADPTDFFVDATTGQLKDFDHIPLALRRCINQIKFRRTEDKFGNVIMTPEITLIDKSKALEMISRYLGLFDQSDKGKTDFKIGFE